MPHTDSYAAAVAAAVTTIMRQTDTTQVQLAAGTGIPQATLSRRLTGRVSFTVEEIAKVATHLNVPVEDLLVVKEAA